ncbi:hypothetical protein ACFX2I_032359 [Malus domestica]
MSTNPNSHVLINSNSSILRSWNLQMVTKDTEARKRFRAEHPVSTPAIADFYGVAKAIESRLCNETWKGGSFFGSTTTAAAADWKDRESRLFAEIKTSGGKRLKR